MYSWCTVHTHLHVCILQCLCILCNNNHLHCSLIRSFDVVNPTTINYEFNWKQKEGPSQIAPVFNCHTPKGQVPGGKKYEVHTGKFLRHFIFTNFVNFAQSQNIAMPHLLICCPRGSFAKIFFAKLLKLPFS